MLTSAHLVRPTSRMSWHANGGWEGYTACFPRRLGRVYCKGAPRDSSPEPTPRGTRILVSRLGSQMIIYGVVAPRAFIYLCGELHICVVLI